MSKIEKRHDDEFLEAVSFGNLQKLEQQVNDLLKTGNPDDAEVLKQLQEKIDENSKHNLKLYEKLNIKIENNHQRKLRYHHVYSTNYKVGTKKSNELGEFLTNKNPTPDEALMKKEEQEERDKVINSLPVKIRIIYKVYLKFMAENNYKKNFSKFTKQFSEQKWKITDKPFKKTVREVQALLKTRKESDE